MTKPIEVNYSHGRPRIELTRPSDGGVPAMPPPSTAETVPFQDKASGRFLPGNAAARRRQVKAKAHGIATLDPARCASWLTPFVKDGSAHALLLMQRFPDPALARLIGATCDAHVMARALLSLAANNDKDAQGEARQWLREYRACMRELAALAGMVGGANTPADPTPWLVRGESK